jgi:hypothetical protein
MANHEDSEEEWDEHQSPDERESRIDDLESRLAGLESERSESSDYGCISAGYGLGATLAMILSWHSNQAVIWALLHGLLSWIYVIYYLIFNWDTVRLL